MGLEPLLATRAQCFFFITIAIQALLVIAMVASILGIMHTFLGDDFLDKAISCNLSMFILAQVFELWVVYDALRMRNFQQLIGIISFHCMLVATFSFQVYEVKVALVGNCYSSQCIDDREWFWKKVQGFLIVVPCIVAASWIPLFFATKQLHREFGRATSYVIGESSKLSSMYQNYQNFLCSLKFDFGCFFAITLRLLIVVIPATDSVEFGVTIAAIPVFLMLTLSCAYAVRNEIKWMMSITLVLILPCTTYLYELDRFYLPSSREDYFSGCWNITMFTVGASIPLFITFWVGFKCFQDFDKGLLDSKIRGINEYQRLSNALEEGIQHRSDNSHRSNDLSGQSDS